MSSDSKKFAYFLPNIFTALNIACGYACIIFAFKGKFYDASMILVLGAIFDSVDGRIARLTGTQSSFGEQFDSISDVVSFGVAPAVLFYHNFLADTGRLGLVVSFFFLLCGALRLARFNANIDRVSSNYFQGLPIPFGALALIGMTLLSVEFSFLKEHRSLAMVYMVIISFLMISNIPFWSFKDATWVRKHKRGALVALLLLISFIAIYEEIMILVVVATYIVSCLGYYFLHRKSMGIMFNWQNDQDEED